MKTVAFAIVALAAGCNACDRGTINCTENSDCVQGHIPGVCMPSPVAGSVENWCAFPDSSCPGAYRWGILSGDGIASACLAAGMPDGGPPDAGPSARYFVADQNNQLFVYDPATLQILGNGVLLAPLDQFNSHLSQAAGTLFVARGAGATESVTALDPLTEIVRAGYPKVAPTPCTLQTVDVGGLYCTNDNTVELHALDNFALLLRSFQAPTGPVSMDVIDGTVLLAFDNEQIFVLDAQLTQLGAPIPATDVRARTVSVSLDRIAIAFWVSPTTNAVRLYNFTTHVQMGADVIFTGDVSGLVFDKEKLFVTLKTGDIAALRVDGTGGFAFPLVHRASNNFGFPTFDATRNRIVAIDGSSLIALDAATLQHVAGSPATLPKPGVSLLVF
jgi:hypothetical protein